MLSDLPYYIDTYLMFYSYVNIAISTYTCTESNHCYGTTKSDRFWFWFSRQDNFRPQLLSLRRVTCDDIGTTQNPNWSVSPYFRLLNQVEDSRLKSFTPCCLNPHCNLGVSWFTPHLWLLKETSLSRNPMKFMTIPGPRQDPATSLRCRRDLRWEQLYSANMGEFATKTC